MRLTFLSLLALVFIALKLMGYIAWAWTWVLAPLWIGFALMLLFIALCAWIAWIKD